MTPTTTDRPPAHLRQWPLIEHAARRVEAMDEYLGALLIGSFAAGTADTLSDVDLFLVVRESAFAQAWARRRDLGFEDDVYAWDWRLPAAPEIGTHRFVTNGLVYVECLIATPSSGARLAEPFRLLAGPKSLPDLLPRRAPIQRADLGTSHPDDPGAAVDEAYKKLVRLLRELGRGLSCG
jgi:hypothetical protein